MVRTLERPGRGYRIESFYRWTSLILLYKNKIGSDYWREIAKCLTRCDEHRTIVGKQRTIVCDATPRQGAIDSE